MLVALLVVVALARLVAAAPAPPADATLETIAVGSCLKQEMPAPILRTVVAGEPDLMVLMGDNVYHDGTPDGLRAAYATLAAHPDFRALADRTPLLAVWDDHDYGADDAGSENPHKADAKRQFLAFFDEPSDSARRAHDGLYLARTMGPPGRRVQVILLDTRWFRSAPPASADDASATVLGAAQWAWLGETLRQPADVRVLVSSIQVVPTEHRWEKWANFPRERARLLKTIAESGAAGVVVVSGDRHRGEISMLDDPAIGYPLWELTSSSLNLPIAGSEPNAFRRGALVEVANVGWLELDWSAPEPRLVLALRDAAGVTRLEQVVPLASLRRVPSADGAGGGALPPE